MDNMLSNKEYISDKFNLLKNSGFIQYDQMPHTDYSPFLIVWVTRQLKFDSVKKSNIFINACIFLSCYHIFSDIKINVGQLLDSSFR